MVEIRSTPIAVICAQASPEVLDRLVAPGYDATVCRTAGDEILVFCPPAVAEDVLREVTDRLPALDEDGLVLDLTDGWHAWTLAGADARDGFASVSALALPDGDGFIQGHVAHVSAKVLTVGDDVTIVVPAYWSEHLRQRLMADAVGAGS